MVELPVAFQAASFSELIQEYTTFTKRFAWSHSDEVMDAELVPSSPDAPLKSLSEEVADWERTLWERTSPGDKLAKEMAEWERTLWENQ